MEAITKKRILIGALAVAVGYGVYKLVQGKQNKGQEVLLSDTVSNSIGTFSAKTIVADLLQAMNKNGTTDEDVYNALSGLTQEQFGQVFRAFGKRPYNKTLGMNTGNDTLFPSVPRDLKYWLKSEFDDANYKLLRTKYPKYL